MKNMTKRELVMCIADETGLIHQDVYTVISNCGTSAFSRSSPANSASGGIRKNHEDRDDPDPQGCEIYIRPHHEKTGYKKLT